MEDENVRQWQVEAWGSLHRTNTEAVIQGMRHKLQQNDEMVAKTPVGTFIVIKGISILQMFMLLFTVYSNNRHTSYVYIITDSKYDLVLIKVRINCWLHRNAILWMWS